MQPSTPTPVRSSALRRYGPLGAIVVVIAVIAALVLVSRSGDDKTAAGTSPSSSTPGSTDPNVISFSQAKAQGKVDSIDWGDRCDTSTGRLKYPSFFAQECYAPFTGDNGGATATGVTKDSIKVVLYQSQPSDPILNYITAAVKVDDTNEQAADTVRGYTQFFQAYYETYGRKVDVVPFTATGNISDPVTARADAVTIAETIKPFAVWGGPQLTNAFADELSARKVLCISCGPPVTSKFYADRAPYVWSITNNAEQGSVHVAEYIGKRLKDGNAEHAGDPALQAEKRVFGLVYITTGEDAEAVRQELEDNLARNGVTLATKLAYKSPTDLQNDAPGMIAKLKDAGVTSVIFAGDPVAPGPLTVAATGQEYHPEWILTGSTLVDTTAFARTYDQEQWSHAFGISFLPARTDPKTSGSTYLYQWYTGSPPPAPGTAPLLVPNVNLFFAVLQGVGPNLTAQTWGDALFNAPPTPRAFTQPSLSYGNKGIWPTPDYLGIDDAVEIWWDAKATGPDEIGRNGTGMYQYVDGGKRYLPGEWPSARPDVFDPTKSIALYTEPPTLEQVPDYPSPAKK